MAGRQMPGVGRKVRTNTARRTSEAWERAAEASQPQAPRPITICMRGRGGSPSALHRQCVAWRCHIDKRISEGRAKRHAPTKSSETARAAQMSSTGSPAHQAKRFLLLSP